MTSKDCGTESSLCVRTDIIISINSGPSWRYRACNVDKAGVGAVRVGYRYTGSRRRRTWVDEMLIIDSDSDDGCFAR